MTDDNTAAFISESDIAEVTPDWSAEKRRRRLKGAIALAKFYAPCLRIEPIDGDVMDIVNEILANAIEHSVKAEREGAASHEQIGPYTVSNFPSRTNGIAFSEKQIDVLRGLCGGSTAGGYSVALGVPDTLPGW